MNQFDMERLHFNGDGLIPAIVVDEKTDKVLMLAYMNRESLSVSLEKKLTCFWSRERKALWTKGETSGHYQHIVSVHTDCDADTLLIRVRKDGPACHLGTESCFESLLYSEKEDGKESLPPGGPAKEEHTPLQSDALYALLKSRKENLPEGSYTTYLFQKEIDKILKKIGEECTEVIIGAKAGDKAETIYELADLFYHAQVLMAEMGITPDEIRRELASRKIIDHKVKQEKMTS